MTVEVSKDAASFSSTLVQFLGDILLSETATEINNVQGMQIDGGGYTVDGQSMVRRFQISNGSVVSIMSPHL
jgi:hypothetical protein